MFHPLSATPEELEVAELDRTQVEGVIRQSAEPHRDQPSCFYALWRLLPDRLAEQHPCFRRLPADTRVPDHTIWHHMSITAGMKAAYSGKNGAAMLSCSLGPVQAFIEAARTVRDLWSGSMILAWLSFQAMLPVIERYGPTAIVYPWLHGLPLLDLWLQEMQVEVPDLTEEARKAPCLPNRFLAVVPWEPDAPNGQGIADLCVEPLDVLFFRDGRPYGAALDGQSQFPLPQTFAGAIRTHLLREAGCDFDRLKERLAEKMPFDAAIDSARGPGWVGRMTVRGPWLARMTDEDRKEFEVLVPMPSTIHRSKGQGREDASEEQGSNPDPLLRLDPLSPQQELPGWQPERSGMRPLWMLPKARTERAEGFLTPSGLSAFLSGRTPRREDVVKSKDLYVFDRRTGIGVHPDRLSAEESLIYTASFLALKPKVRWYVEVVLPDDAPADPFAGTVWLALGGEGRQARIECVEPFAWPEPPQAPGAGTLLLLTTPGVFDAGWCPNCLSQDGRLVAASVPGRVAVSGWDLARRGPKPARFAVPAGSVYFVSNSVDTLPQGSLADKVEDAREGWGCYLKGAWNYVGTKN